jgi:hypothetical protein
MPLHPQRRKQTTQWKGPHDVKQLRMSLDVRQSPIEIGRGKTGVIYAGRLQFDGSKTRRVAIKRFNVKEFLSVCYSGATPHDFGQGLKSAVGNLLKLGIPVPKMGVKKIQTQEHPEGEYVLIMPLYGSASKPPGERSHFKMNEPIGKKDSLDVRKQALSIRTRLYNQGYFGEDVLASYRSPRKGVRVLDIDGFIMHEINQIVAKREKTSMKIDYYKLGHELNNLVAEWANNPTEYKVLLQQAWSEARLELRSYLARR